MQFDPAPTFIDYLIYAEPLRPQHFDELYAAASDPLIWEQHPNRDRYTMIGFTNYFEGAIKSGSAFIVRDAKTGEAIGSSRYSVLTVKGNDELTIGYTFFKRSHWRKGYNRSLKKLMLQHAFQFTDKVYFYIGAVNKRSQESIEKLGAIKIHEEETAYFGEAPKLDYVYAIGPKDLRI